MLTQTSTLPPLDNIEHNPALAPHQSALCYRLAQLSLQRGQVQDAASHAQHALNLSPETHRYRLLLAHCCLQRGDINSAIKHANTLILNPNLKADELDTLGHIYSRIGDLEKSFECLEKAYQHRPSDKKYIYNYALACRTRGYLDKAERLIEKALSLQPDDWEAYLTRSQLRPQTLTDNHIEELQQLLEKNKSLTARINLGYALAKECEDTGQYEQSFIHLQQASDLRRRHSRYQVEGDLDTIHQIQKSYDDTTVNEAGGDDNSEAIFVLGLPRTGTTLVERIIGTHSSVISAGELHNFSTQLVQQTQQQFGAIKHKLDLVEHSTQLPSAKLGKAYINSTRALTGKSPRFIDKMPLNFLYIGAINRALPNAKIIHLTRNPMDACYAIYKTQFKQTYPFSYDLNDLASYYIAYRKLMRHWKTVMGEKLHFVSYEGLVKEQETCSRQLLDFCQLEWDPACLDFHHSAKPSTTASACQIRQPIHQRSVGQWRNFRQQLVPLYKALYAAGLDPEHW